MTTDEDLQPIELEAKSDRELLLMIAAQQNVICRSVNTLMSWKNGNGTPGAQFQIRLMWLCFMAVITKIWSGK